MKALRIIAVLGAVTALAGCDAAPSAEPTPTAVSEEMRVQLCAEAAAGIVVAVDDVIADYEQSGAAPGEPGPDSTPAVPDGASTSATRRARPGV